MQELNSCLWMAWSPKRRARFTNVDQAWTKFKYELNLGLAVICVWVKLGLTLNRHWHRIKLWSPVQLALCSGPTPKCIMIPAIFVQMPTVGIQYICVGLLHPVWGHPSMNNYNDTLMHESAVRVVRSFVGAILCVITVILITRDSIYAMLSPIRLSVRLSHGWIIQKRLKLGLWNFYHTVALSL